MAEYDWQYGVGISLPSRATLDTDSSTFTLSDTRPEAAPQNNALLTVTARGAAPTGTVYLRTQEGGIVAGTPGATFVERDEDSGDWYGYDVQALGRRQVILEVTSSGTYQASGEPHVAPLPDGRIAVVHYAQDTRVSSEHRVLCTVVDVDGSTSTNAVFARSSAPGGGDWLPCLVITELGRWLCYTVVVDSAASTAQVQVHYSDDDGETWQAASEACLPEPIDLGQYNIQRIRAAESGGAVCMLMWRRDTSGAVSRHRDQVVQYASRDYGQHFVEVDVTDEDDTDRPRRGMASPDIIRLADGAFLVVGIDADDLYLRAQRIGDAFHSFLATSLTTIDTAAERATESGTPSTVTPFQSVSVTQDAGGAVYVVSGAGGSGFQGSTQFQTTLDGGRTWRPIGYGRALFDDGEYAYRPEATLLALQNGAIATQAGRIVMACRHSTSTDYDGSIALVAFGGSSNVTLPTMQNAGTRLTQVTPDTAWLPIDVPGSSGHTTTVGSGTQTLEPEYLTVSTAAASSRSYITTLDSVSGGNATRGCIARVSTQIVSGGSLSTDHCIVRVAAEDSSESYTVTLRLTATSARLVDTSGSASAIGADVSLSSASAYDWLIALADGEVRTWYRPHDWQGRQLYVDGPAGSVTDGGTSASDRCRITWGHLFATSSESRWHELSATNDVLTGTQLTTNPTNPNDLLGREWNPQGAAVGPTGTVVRARGATVRGDEVRVIAASDSGTERLSSGSPRRPCRLDASVQNDLYYDLGGGADESWDTDVLVVAMFGANVARVVVKGVDDTGAETTLATIDTWDGLELDAEVAGNTVSVQTGGSDIDTPTLAYDELTGCHLTMTRTAGNARDMRPITGNREGRWSTTAGSKARIFVDDADADWATTGTARVIPRQWAACIDLQGQTFEKIKLQIPSQTAGTFETPVDGEWVIGYLHVGAMTAHAHDPAWGNGVTTQVESEILRARDGQRDGVELAPLTRRMRIGWVDGIRTYRVTNPSFDFDGDYFKVSDASSSDGMGQAGLVLYSLQGVIRRTLGGLRPIVYLPRVERFDGSDTVQLLNRYEQVALAHIDSPVARDRVVGLDQHGSLVRGDVWELEEAT